MPEHVLKSTSLRNLQCTRFCRVIGQPAVKNHVIPENVKNLETNTGLIPEIDFSEFETGRGRGPAPKGHQVQIFKKCLFKLLCTEKVQ